MVKTDLDGPSMLKSDPPEFEMCAIDPPQYDFDILTSVRCAKDFFRTFTITHLHNLAIPGQDS